MRARRIEGTVFERFADKALIGDDCWEWQAGHHNYGYGTLGGKGWRAYAHRLSYELFVGPVPKWLCVLHRCDNPNCVKPSHLFLGTKKDNTQDMLAKGRNRVFLGQDNPNAKLTPNDVRTIRALVAMGVSTRETGRTFDISHQTVRAIRDRRGWGWVE